MRWWSEINDVQSQIVVCCCWGGKCHSSFCLCAFVCRRGNSKYHYYGIRLKPDSPLNRLQEDTQYMAMRQQPVHQKQRWNEHLFFAITKILFVCMSYSIVQNPARDLDSLNPCLIMSHTGWIYGHSDQVLSQTQKTSVGFVNLFKHYEWIID